MKKDGLLKWGGFIVLLFALVSVVMFFIKPAFSPNVGSGVVGKLFEGLGISKELEKELPALYQHTFGWKKETALGKVEFLKPNGVFITLFALLLAGGVIAVVIPFNPKFRYTLASGILLVAGIMLFVSKFLQKGVDGFIKPDEAKLFKLGIPVIVAGSFATLGSLTSLGLGITAFVKK